MYVSQHGFDTSEMGSGNCPPEEREAQSDPSVLRREGKQYGFALNNETPNSKQLIFASGGVNLIGEAAGKTPD